MANLSQLSNKRPERLANIVGGFGAPQLDTQIPPLLVITLKRWVDLGAQLPGGGRRAGYGLRTEWLNAPDRKLVASELGDSVRA
ncbi:hypothetical protein NtRootA4_08910 [Arthrobacter sp. NtRootA4]|nr:hypothetical protein NtRootA2_11120 [Arthrobacter sp. NtRootA2]BCW13912.1 hypothetical protein NtRootA4_08910 [Arthrobacter sp. NtRootA4]BCW22247.1 hypothetical protein NtRootC7_11140 [Arthrobacter sp. NtRootC7]BCW26515.1 hypothetical protein NtRootC45_11150 [Arthrobacter sp. NtRootC45]BCW30784.1 hypothetical protein NtRootD5_11150 [Arthrobacter sp. NtRootD5]